MNQKNGDKKAEWYKEVFSVLDHDEPSVASGKLQYLDFLLRKRSLVKSGIGGIGSTRAGNTRAKVDHIFT